ncbi:hybrid PKS-NRPS synthetase lepA [Colletotrichum spaethianum]|uniref:Hybrid PKS-NRPS synthetase lepA n=1 Tax=Colletotrichum spaethianum TaxID=700344 RepID=A0AA37US14_9PEZI|nr:hybrid PKS-NRPS synthetase lepA [Colletotrichum spaethianum]GKT51797.1 hybrid PKS-NRPS synthetase lepA [Colletotrichum spaethianum]
MAGPVGIIGSACRFPGKADSPAKLWELLRQPRDVLCTFSKDRLNLQSFYHQNGEHHGSTDVQNKGYLLSEDIRLFDASFFRISPAEAAAMDPQQRILLETVYEALESAGLPLDQLQGSLTSVWAGLMNGDFADVQARDLDTLPAQHATGTHRSILSNRISYFLDARAASMTIDTACSSSLVALHQAVQSLRSGESDMAIVAGVNLILDPTMYVAESKLHMLSPDSRSRMWDKGANGYARGEGFAAIVLQRLGDAVRDGNHIECVIRGTAVNSDGRGKGAITVPSAAAQTALIGQAYRDAGLDARRDRCQFFEAHGTGTQAGDPVEAQAIRDAFFPTRDSDDDGDNSEVPPGKLLVGSIKTVVGHLEGCAGLAGVLKASLAIQNRTVPPNMLFSELNPAINPFYERLEIPTGQARPWPETKSGSPLRVSVNSFGFGGTNAHVILESYVDGEQQQFTREEHSDDERFVGPLVFSAHSRDCLVRVVQAHAEEVRSNKVLDLGDLAWTLQSRRTHFNNSRAAFSGATRQKLLSYMDAFVADTATALENQNEAPPRPSRPGDHGPDEAPALLGIFTGQGAQWASMGRNLILHCRLFRESIERCEKSLAALGADAPKWSLTEELIADAAESRVAEAALSQPLCTAVQIGLVDLLRASGVRFRAVVGHSSGEIAAAYAAGILPRASDAIRIAYYRGLHTRLAGSGSGGGGMLAASLSWDDACGLCARPEYDGRISVAADNSPTSVTLSGDVDVIDQVEAHLTAEGTFARKLKVDMAYHSRHMQPCAPAYLASLRSCEIQVQQPADGCVWVSSVRGDVDSVLAEDDDDGDEGSGLEAVRDQYWVDNLTNPVLFGPAVECALWRAGPFDAVLEVGPHSALKSPATQIFKASLGAPLPYVGVMQRGHDEVEAFSGGLGYLWEHLGSAAPVDFSGYCWAFNAGCEGAEAETRPPRLAKGLPAYRWDHAKVHWRESRLSRNFRLADRPSHGLLGRRAPDNTPSQLRWRNVLRLDEMPWVKGHVFQGQVVLPGTSYLSAIIAAATALAGASPVTLVDLCDVVLHRAVVLRENSSCDFTTDLRLVRKGQHLLSAEFSFSAAQSDSDAAPDVTCSGRVEVHLGEGEGEGEDDANREEALLPSPSQPPPNLGPVDVDLFYSSLKKVGLAFSGLFRGTKSAQRSLRYASTSASWDEADGDMDIGNSSEASSVHPAVLDVALHALFAAFASPATEQMWTPYLPVAIRRASIAVRDCPSACATPASSLSNSTSSSFPFPSSSQSPLAGRTRIAASISAQVTASSPKGFEGDVQVVFGDSGRVAVQIEGVTMRTMANQASSADGDCVLFSHVKWDSDISTGIDRSVLDKGASEQGDGDHGHLVDAMGRTALFYYRTLLEELSPYEVTAATWHHRMFVQSAQHWIDLVREGHQPTVKSEWLDDTKEAVWQHADRLKDHIDIELMRAVGENLVSIIRGEKQPLEIMMEDNMLTRFYVDGHGLGPMNDHIARAVGQIVHRYPRANILEVGAGTGGTTRKVLRTVGNAYGHYTFTDVSPGFFERAADRFSDHVRRHSMTFQVLDIEKDVMSQGFSEGAYDVIVAANVLHATQHLQDTMRQVRRLLKPGGYLVMMEITGDLLRLGFILGVLSGWWLGPQIGDEGRKWAPGIPTAQWDDLLRRTGFSGVDHATSDSPVLKNHYLSMLVTQAVDDRVDLLRSPLSHLATLPALPDVAKLLIIGGDTPVVARLAQDLRSALAPWASTTIETVSSVDKLVVSPHERVSAISLIELDQPLFGPDNLVTAARLQRLQAFLQRARSVLWVTAGCRGSNPQANMFAGIARAVRAEQRDINLQLLDIRLAPDDADTSVIAEAFIRLALAGQPEFIDAPNRQPMLWSTETELASDAGSLLIPRLVPDGAKNDRYNAARRIVTKQIDAWEAEVDWDFEVECSDGILSLTGLEHTVSRCLTRARTSSSAGLLLMDVQLSVPLLHPEHRHFLCYGSIAAGSTTPGRRSAFAVTRSNASVALVDVDGTIPLPSGDSPCATSTHHRASKLLEALAGQLVARSLVPRVPRRGPILLHEPAETLVRAIAGCRLWRGRRVYCMSSSLPEKALPEGWISINAHALDSSVRQTLPDDVAAMIDFSVQGAGIKRDLRPCLPADCVVIRFEPAFLETDSEALGYGYADALSLVDSEAAGDAYHEVHVIPRDALLGRPSSSVAYPAIVDWHVRYGNSSDKVTVQVKALNTTGIFSSSKTHLMVGLNGDLGQSICGFMARNGARHIAITSRGGEVNPEWLTTMQRQGINVGVYAMDVTNKDDIRATLEQMRSDGMPAVGGVANGALVLRDKLFLNMDVESFNDTLRPKVDGSRHLDELFGDELDYFVLFSSLATVAGNAGQSNYHAANMFMAGLAANRRARGLPASVMHVGVVADAGYVTRQGRQLLDHLRKQFFMPISESDAHQLFTEAVLASRPDSGLPADICMGLEPFPDRPGDADLVRPSWVSDHRLSHFVLPPPDEDKQAAGSCGVGVNDDKALPLSQRIDSTSSAEAAEAMLQDAFSAKLETLLQLDAGSINVHAPLLDLGFDSLLAVETRTWFLREISVDVPVLRFLGGETIYEICADTAATYLALRGANGSDVSDGADTNLTIRSDDLDDPVASSQSSAPSIVTPPLTSSPKTSARVSIDLPSGHEDLKTKASLSKSETKADSDANSDTVIQTQSSQPQKRLRNTSRVERLSYLQSRLWSLGEALDDPGASNIAVCYSITGPLDVPKLREAFAKVVVHHPSLRTCIYPDDETGEPTQALLRQPPSSTLLLKQVHAATRDDGVIAREFSALKNRAWDLAYGETFGAVLVHVEDEDAYAIIFSYPLIFMDGVSWSVFLRDLGRAYSAQTLSRQTKLCIDAAAEQRRAVESMSGSGAMREAISYWERLYTELPEPLPFLPLASATHRKPLRRYEVHKCLRNIDSHLVAKIKDASRALRATPFHFYLATAQALFSKLLPDLAEICIGVFDANRPDDGSGSLADVVGYFVNVLPLRFRLLDDERRPAASSFAEMVRNTAMHELEARRHGHVPFDVILDRLNVPRDDTSVSPLCQTAFNYRVGAMADVALGDDCRLAVDSYSDVQNNRYDLSFGLFESAAGSYSVTVTCKSYIYSWDATDVLVGAYVHLLDALASDASRTLSDYVLSGPAIEALEGTSLDKGRCET